MKRTALGKRIAGLEQNGSIRKPVLNTSNYILKKKPPEAVGKASILHSLLTERQNKRFVFTPL